MEPSSNAPVSVDAIVVGAGPAGLTAAIALADAGVRTALVARRAPYADNRTTALLGGSIDLLEQLDVWRRCTDRSAPLRSMRLVDDTGRLIRAPEVTFNAQEIGREAFGFNIENRELTGALEARADEMAGLLRIDDDAAMVVPGDDFVEVTSQAGRAGRVVTARVAVGADGRRSICREAAGIPVTRRELPQSAVTFNVAHTHPHRNVSTEFHTPHGPCVFVPLPGDRCSVVWVMTPGDARRLADVSDDELSIVTERQSQSILGRISVEPGRHVFPLAIEQPRHFAKDRIMLVGEAAHVLPPIGAQGLNMGLRDTADLAAIVSDVLSAGGDPGSTPALQRYDRARRADVVSRSTVIDLANRSLISDFVPLQAARAAGLHLLNAVAPLRRIAMREGLAPSWRRG